MSRPLVMGGTVTLCKPPALRHCCVLRRRNRLRISRQVCYRHSEVRSYFHCFKPLLKGGAVGDLGWPNQMPRRGYGINDLVSHRTNANSLYIKLLLWDARASLIHPRPQLVSHRRTVLKPHTCESNDNYAPQSVFYLDWKNTTAD